MDRQRGITCVGASGDCSPTTLHIVLSSKGRTSDFDSDNGGSNPSGTTFLIQIFLLSLCYQQKIIELAKSKKYV